MWRFLFIAFLLAHGAIHAAIWAPMWGSPKPDSPQAPFDAGHSWLLGDQRALATVIALAAAALLIAGGIGLWAHAEWWRPVGVVGLAASFGLMVLYFNPWFLPIESVNAGLIVGIAWFSWPSAATLGG